MSGSLSLDMFVLRKKKSTYLTALLVFACAVVASIALKSATNQEVSVDTSLMGILVQSAGLASLFLGMFFVMFIGSDLKNGFIKNTAGTVKNRVVYSLSKQVTLAVYSVTAAAALCLGALASSKLFFDGKLGTDAVHFAKYIGVWYLLLVGLASLVTFLVFTFRNTTAPMVVILLLTSGTVMNLIYNPLETLLDKVGTKFEFRYISVSSNLISLSADSTNKDLLIAAAVGLGYVIVFNVLGKIVMDKKDIA